MHWSAWEKMITWKYFTIGDEEKWVCVRYLKYTELGGRLETENKRESCQRLPHDFCTEIRTKTIYGLPKDRA